MASFEPRVCYADVGAAADFLERAFGFKTIRRSNMGSRVVHAEMSFGEARLTLGGDWDHVKPPSALGGANTQTITVAIDKGIDEHFARACAAGAQILQEPTDMFHGDRTYRALDPQGHMWVFSQKIREVSKEELEAALPGIKIL